MYFIDFNCCFQAWAKFDFIGDFMHTIHDCFIKNKAEFRVLSSANKESKSNTEKCPQHNTFGKFENFY